MQSTKASGELNRRAALSAASVTAVIGSSVLLAEGRRVGVDEIEAEPEGSADSVAELGFLDEAVVVEVVALEVVLDLMPTPSDLIVKRGE